MLYDTGSSSTLEGREVAGPRMNFDFGAANLEAPSAHRYRKLVCKY
jgi:hypothetical protein